MPGRRFSAALGLRSAQGWREPWRLRLSFVSLRASRLTTARGEMAADARDAARAGVWGALRELAGVLREKRAEERTGRACLVVDHAEEELGWHNDLATELLGSNPGLCMLVVRRTPLWQLNDAAGQGTRWKPVNIEVPPISPTAAAELLLRRVHRPLVAQDFPDSDIGVGDDPSLPINPGGLLPRLSSHPSLMQCAGYPDRIVRLAADVVPRGLPLVQLAAQASPMSVGEGSCVTASGEVAGEMEDLSLR